MSSDTNLFKTLLGSYDQKKSHGYLTEMQLQTVIFSESFTPPSEVKLGENIQ